MAEVSKDGTVSNSAAEIYQSPTGQVTIFTSLSVGDLSGSANTVSVYLANDGAAAADANLLQTIDLNGDEQRSVGLLQGKRCAQGGKLYVKGSGGSNNTTYHLSGRTVSQSRSAESIG